MRGRFRAAVKGRGRWIAGPTLVTVGIVAAGLGAAAHAQAPPTFQTSDVPEYDVFELPPPQPQTGASFGERMRTLDDVVGDGARDVLISSPRFDDGELVDAGRVYVVSGRTRAVLQTIGPPDPQAGATFGFWHANLHGDADGDGVGDFVVSAPGVVIDGQEVGRVYVFSGRTGGVIRTVNAPEPLGPTGRFGGDFGGNVIGPGDLSGDGIGDFVATASGAFDSRGAAYAFNGRTGELLYKVPNPESQASSFGFGAAELGDLNRDGAGDYQIGAPRFDEDALADVGRSYIIDGRTGNLIKILRNPEPEANARFGQADADGVSLGDITGDGTPDIYVDSFLADVSAPNGGAPLTNAGKVFLFDGVTGDLIRRLPDPAPETNATFGASNASAGDLDRDGRPDSLVSSRGGNNGEVTIFGGTRLETILKIFQDPSNQDRELFGSSIASPGDVNGDGHPDYFISARAADVNGLENAGTVYQFLSDGPVPPPPPPPLPTSPSPGPVISSCATPGAPGYLFPAKMRVRRAEVDRDERVLDVFAPITSRARGGVEVTYQGDRRTDTFDAEVTEGDAVLDRIRFREPITRGQAALGTGIVTLDYKGDEDTRPEEVRLRAASGRAELDVDRISLIDGRLSAQGSVTGRAEGIVRFRYSYIDAAGKPQVHPARATIQDDGDWQLDDDAVPPQLARCGGYLSILFTGYFERRVRGEMLAYQLNPGQTREPTTTEK